MITQRLFFGSAGIAICALVLLAIRAGWFPSHGTRIDRKSNPFAFWFVMALGAGAGAVFLSLAAAL